MKRATGARRHLAAGAGYQAHSDAADERNQTTMAFLSASARALRLSLPKLGVAYMAVLLTANFNRVAINELGIAAILITTLAGLHYFLSPFQVVFGWLSDRAPLLGWRRTPYLILGALLASSIFPFLPSLLVAIGTGSGLAVALAFALLLLYGIGLAAYGDCHHALMADIVPERQRGPTVMLVWLFLIVGFIASSILQQVLMPVYDPQAMQTLYNLAPLVVMGSVLLGVAGLEPRQPPAARQQLGNPLAPAAAILRESPQARAFLAFIFLAMLGIFLQDGLLEVYGAEVFGLAVGATTAFTQSWNIGALVGMLLMGLLAGLLQISRRLTTGLGALLTALGLIGLATSAYFESLALLQPAIGLMGLGAGVFNIGALTLMMEMTTDADRGTYMGLWGMAQAFGMGLAALLGGGAHTALIERLGLAPTLVYTGFFLAEAALMLLALVALRAVRGEQAGRLAPSDLTGALAT
jgi:MFS transporter, BCD family, chlorophyll transporter